jgi:hypothetical protein
VSVQAAVPSAVCVSHLPSHCLSLCLTLSLSLCLTVCLTVSLSVSPSHCPSVSLLSLSPVCLTVSPSIAPFAPQTIQHGHVQPSLTGPCNDTNCIVCEVGTGFSNTIQTAQHKNTAMFNFHFCITLCMFQTYSSLSRVA